MNKTVSSVNQVKDHNTRLILDALKTVPSATKNLISQMTGLSIGTCNTILNELSAAGKAFEAEGDYAASGRPPKAYTFNADFSHICCLYLTHEDQQAAIHYAIVDLLGKVLESGILEKDEIAPEIVISVIEELILNDPLITSISIGIPGYLYEDRVRSVCLPGLADFPLKKALTEHFQMDVHCDNDMNIISLGLFRELFPDTADPFTVIGLFNGQGPGAGTIVDQKIVKGMSNFAGEVLHMNAADPDFWYDISSHYEEALEKAFLITLSYITVINPATIVFTGKNAAGSMVKDIREKCSHCILDEHLPRMMYIDDITSYYISGLFAKTER